MVQEESTPRCQQLSTFEGSEDASLWRAGLAFQSSGLCPSATQSGMMLAVNLSAVPMPTVVPMQLHNLSDTFGFRPHGIHIDNVTRRIYAVSHSDLLQEESIFVFDVLETMESATPALAFRYTLVSPNFRYFGRENIWFLNDLVVIDGELELYATQFGPQPVPSSNQTQTKDKRLFRCTWREVDLQADGRLPADCRAIEGLASLGLNGIAIQAPAPSRSNSSSGSHSRFGSAGSGATLWVNDLYRQQLWTFERQPDGSLVRGHDVPLPGTIDNVEFDRASGDLTMGMFYDAANQSSAGGLMLARWDAGTGSYGSATVAWEQDTGGKWQVSTSLIYGPYTLLGSPWDLGPLICENQKTI